MSKLVDGLLGGGKQVTAPLQNFQPIGIGAGGFNFSRSGNNIVGGSTPERTGLVNQLSSLFRDQAGQIGGLRQQVAPGFSRIRQGLMESLGRQRTTRLGQIETERTRALGDLRENLARRRVLGSSFAQDALSRGEAEFTRQKDVALSEIGQQEALADYEATLKEIDTTRQLMTQEFDLARGSVGSILENMNLEASVAAGLATGATAALSKNAQVQSDLLQKQANNKQSFLTDVLGVGLGFATGGISLAAGLGK